MIRKLKNALHQNCSSVQQYGIPDIAAISVSCQRIIWNENDIVVVGIHIAPHKLKPHH